MSEMSILDQMIMDTMSQEDMVRVINKMARDIDLPTESHLEQNEEDTFMRLWDMRMFGMHGTDTNTNTQIRKMWRDIEDKVNKNLTHIST